MNIVGETFLRHCLKPRVECDLPGRLRMRFRHSEQLSKEALPYLHYVQDVLTMLPGVTDVTVNARIGTALVLYDAQTTSSRQILRWWISLWTQDLKSPKRSSRRRSTNRSWSRLCASG